MRQSAGFFAQDTLDHASASSKQAPSQWRIRRRSGRWLNRGCGRLSFFLFETLQIWRLSGHHFGSVSIIQ
jgi:hypothetical protein